MPTPLTEQNPEHSPAQPNQAQPKWSVERAWRWHQAQPYLFGANFTPSTAINQLEMWQADTFDPETISRELGYARRINMNCMRVYLHDLLWSEDADGFCDRINQYLDIADAHNIKTIFVIFDDCWRSDFSLGPQPDPIPYQHNSGWVQSPGFQRVNDATSWPPLKSYLQGLLTRFGQDERILFWDLYNEPGNGACGDDSLAAEKQGEKSLPFLKAVFQWAREVTNIKQPMTSAVWHYSPEFKRINDFLLNASDINSFHCYLPAQPMLDLIETLTELGRPLICTEYMARGTGSNFEHSLTLMHKKQIGAINWGLVSGKTQTIYPWGWHAAKGKPDILFHDIFHADGSLLYPNEAHIFELIE